MQALRSIQLMHAGAVASVRNIKNVGDLPDFDRFDLSAFRAKFCTSAPFSAELPFRVCGRGRSETARRKSGCGCRGSCSRRRTAAEAGLR